jgi:hypothetical protein
MTVLQIMEWSQSHLSKQCAIIGEESACDSQFLRQDKTGEYVGEKNTPSCVVQKRRGSTGEFFTIWSILSPSNGFFPGLIFSSCSMDYDSLPRFHEIDPAAPDLLSIHVIGTGCAETQDTIHEKNRDTAAEAQRLYPEKC